MTGELLRGLSCRDWLYGVWILERDVVWEYVYDKVMKREGVGASSPVAADIFEFGKVITGAEYSRHKHVRREC